MGPTDSFGASRIGRPIRHLQLNAGTTAWPGSLCSSFATKATRRWNSPRGLRGIWHSRLGSITLRPAKSSRTAGPSLPADTGTISSFGAAASHAAGLAISKLAKPATATQPWVVDRLLDRRYRPAINHGQ